MIGLLVLTLMMVKALKSSAQGIIDFSTCVGNPGSDILDPVFVNFDMGVINISATGVGGETVTMSITNIAYEIPTVGIFDLCGGTTPACPSPSFTHEGVTVAVAGSSVEISGTPGNFFSGMNLRVLVHATATNIGNCDRTFVLPIVRKPIDLVLVLDRSGSMECPPGDYNWSSCIAPNFNADSRWAKLKEAINQVATKLNDNAIEDDEMSIVLFDGALKTTASGGVDATMLTGFFPTDDVNFESKVSDILNDQVQPLGRNGTGIGGAMKEAVERLPVDDSKLRIIMLFTDGEQNVTPYVRDFLPDLGKYVEVVPPPPFFLNNGTEPNTIEKFTVGFGSLPLAYNTLLENIATNNANYFSTTSGNDGTFGSILLTDFVNQVFIHSSPQNVTERRKKLSGNFSEEVTINQNVSKIYLEVFLENARTRGYSFSVWHAGNDVTQLAKKTRILNSSVLYIFDKENLDDAGIPIEGKWELRATQSGETSVSPNAEYTFSATADDHLLDMEFSADATRFKIGDKVKPSVKLTYKAEPLVNSKVSALLIGPTDDLGDNIARETVKPFDPTQDPDAGSLYTQKLGQLLEADPSYLQMFVDQNPANKITLTDPENDGTYSGEFDSTLIISGIHHLIYFIEHIDGADTIIRQKRQTLLVNPDDIDLDRSGLMLTTGNENETLLTIMPTDKRGRRLGLGLVFHMEADEAEIKSIQENLDGSYVLTITGELNGQGKLTILDMPVFEGDLAHLSCYDANASFIQKIKCWLMSIGLPGWTLWIILLLILVLAWLLWKKLS